MKTVQDIIDAKQVLVTEIEKALAIASSRFAAATDLPAPELNIVHNDVIDCNGKVLFRVYTVEATIEL